MADLVQPAVARWRTREIGSFAENSGRYSIEDAGQDSKMQFRIRSLFSWFEASEFPVIDFLLGEDVECRIIEDSKIYFGMVTGSLQRLPDLKTNNPADLMTLAGCISQQTSNSTSILNPD